VHLGKDLEESVEATIWVVRFPLSK
jgi:hypothetical protein